MDSEEEFRQQQAEERVARLETENKKLREALKSVLTCPDLDGGSLDENELRLMIHALLDEKGGE